MELLKEMELLARQAGEIVLSARNIESVVEEKTSAADLVTAYDQKVEMFLKESLPRLVEGSRFLGEEETETVDPGEGWCFVVDPIDGTTNFIRDLAQSAVSIALARDGIVEYGVVFNPYRDEMFTAARGRGAFRNGEPIHVSDRPLSQGIFALGSSPYYGNLKQRTLEIAGRLFDIGCDFRRMASAALDLCNIACGRVDAYFECELSPWDYAAGSLLVEEAGGRISTLEGTPLQLDRHCSLWASNRVNGPLREAL